MNRERPLAERTFHQDSTSGLKLKKIPLLTMFLGHLQSIQGTIQKRQEAPNIPSWLYEVSALPKLSQNTVKLLSI